MVLGSAEVLLLLQRGYVDVGFMGGAQIDQFGNLNSSFIGDPAKPKTRLPGTGGGNDISSLAQMIVAMKHEKRRFVEHVDFITSPGLDRGRRHAPRKRAAGRRHVPGRHRSRALRLRREDAAHEGAGAQSRRDARAGAGQHRLRARRSTTTSARPSRRPRRSSPCCASSIPSASTPLERNACSTGDSRWPVSSALTASPRATSPPIRRCPMRAASSSTA